MILGSLFLFSLLFALVWAADPVVVRGIVSPTNLLERQCGARELLDGGRVHIKMVFFGYCKLSPTSKKIVDELFPNFRVYLKDLVDRSQRYFLWEVTATVELPPADTCTLPDGVGAEIHGDLNVKASGQNPDYILASVIMPSEDVNVVHDINGMMGNIVSTFTMCSMSKQACISIRDAIANSEGDKYPFFMIDVIDADGPTMPPPMYVLSGLGCNPSYLGSIPFETQNDGGGQAHCECVCPFGHEFVPIPGVPSIHECKPIQEPNDQEDCTWLNRCYSLTVSNSDIGQLSHQCNMKNFYGDELVIPRPWDNYVSETLNIESKGAQITATFKNHMTEAENVKSYPWTTFQENQNQHLQSLSNFDRVGLYSLEIRASDYKQATTCSTEIEIVDDVHPIGALPGTCPTSYGDAAAISWFDIDRQHLNAAVQVLYDHKSFDESRKNDPCGDGSNCDYRLYTRTDLFQFDGVDVSAPADWKDAFILTATDADELRKISTKITEAVPGQKTLKCWTARVHFGEKVLDYQCAEISTGITKENADTDCRFGENCFVEQCLYMHSDAMFTGTIKTSDVARARSTEIMVHWLDNEDWNAVDKEIHDMIEEVAVGTGINEGTKTLDLSTLIDIERLFTPLAKAPDMMYNGVPVTESILCRYTTDENFIVWNFHGSNEVVFSEVTTELTIECWSVIGEVVTETFEVIIHAHSALALVCESFERMSWYQSLDAPRIDGSNQYCNVPGTDFGEITFDFVHDIGREKADGHFIPYNFVSIKCEVNYLEVVDKVDPMVIATPAELFSYADPNLRVIKRYGIDLKHGPTDSNTPIVMSCTLNYRSTAGKDDTLYCNPQFAFCDCTKPEFPLSHITDVLEECNDNCGDKIQPFSYCGNNHIYYTPPPPGGNQGSSLGMGTTNYDAVNSKSCCSDCGDHDFVCAPLASATETQADPTLQYCAPVTPLVNANVLMEQLSSSTVVATGLSLFVFAVFAAVMVRRARHDEIDQSAYLPLI